MPNHTLIFADPINSSVQVGDTAYYTTTNAAGATADAYQESSTPFVVALGPIVNIINQNGEGDLPITIVVQSSVATVPAESYIMFSKDGSTNTSGIIGYYAEVTLINNSTKKAEIYVLSSDIVPSSK